MKSQRFRRSFRSTASSLHRVIGKALTFPPFDTQKVYQEYPVNKINSYYPNPRHKFDWVVLSLKLVIEAHGRQHFEPINHFLGKDTSILEQMDVDRRKRLAAETAGFTYVMVPYYCQDLVTPDYLWKLYVENFNDLSPEASLQKPNFGYIIKRNQKAREYRKAQYQKLKRLKGDRNGISSHRYSKNNPKTSN